jgi:hypothetical protein
MLGGLPFSPTAIPEPKQDVPCGPSPDAIAAARDLIGAGSSRPHDRLHPGRNPVMSGLIALGVDLGLDGAVMPHSGGAKLLGHFDMPTLQDGPPGRRSGNAILLSEIIAKTGATMAYIEYVGARPGEAPSGAFSFGRSRGVVEGICAALNVRVQARDWPAQAALMRLGAGDAIAAQGTPNSRHATVSGKLAIQHVLYVESILSLQPEGAIDGSL